MIERVIAALKSAQDRHRSEALRVGAKDGVDPAYTYGVAVGMDAGLALALRTINECLSEADGGSDL